jgi:hypothetical protein
MQTLHYYKYKAGDEGDRRDPLEGVSIISHPQPGMILEIQRLPSPEAPGPHPVGRFTHDQILGPVVLSHEAYLRQHALCCSCVPEEDFMGHVQRNKYTVVVRDVNMFMERLSAGILHDGGWGFEYGRVEYFANDDTKFLPNIGFHKANTFAHQHEYRFVIDAQGQRPDPWTLSVGGLSDICLIFKRDGLPS